MKSLLAAITIGVIGLSIAGFAVHARAAGPQLLITWKAADSSTPAGYAGKALPGVYSTIVASAAVLSNGSLASLSSRTIYWYLDDNFIGGGTGKTTITFQAPGHTEIAALRVMIPDYPSGQLINVGRIPIVDPKVVIVAPYAARTFSGSSLNAHAEPYFWDAASLKVASIQWTVNGEAVTSADNPQDLLINLGNNVGHTLPVSITVFMQKGTDPLMNARSSVTLTSQ